jgi:mono/diheme cytochrome c family protein
MKRFEVAMTGLVLVLAWSTAGCSKTEPQRTAPSAAVTQAPVAAQPAPAAEADPKAEAKALFKTRCVVCHGDHGAGDGPGAAAIEPKPRAFADAAWQASVTDEHIEKIILEGGRAVGKSPAMPPNPDLNDKEAVVTELVAMIRAFKK